MKIKLFPFLGFETMEASVSGDVITINGEAIDLGPLPDGFRLLGEATGNKFFVPTEYIQRIDGELHFTLFLHVEAETDEQWRNPPEPLILSVTKGKVPIPDTSPPAPEVPDITIPGVTEPTEESPIIETPEPAEPESEEVVND